MACDLFLLAALGFDQAGVDIAAQQQAGGVISEGYQMRYTSRTATHINNEHFILHIQVVSAILLNRK